MLPLSEADQQFLLRLARRALEESVRHDSLPEGEAPPGPLREKCGAFVTLHKMGRLRGCIGYLESLKPLYQTICECAMAAALRDPRFDAVTPEELPVLHLEISVLSPLVEITPDQVEVGRHGLLISRGGLRGVLLPQVPVEWKWDREQFLEETCLKAGLPPDAWRHGAKIQAFTAQVFGEPPAPGRPSRHGA
ncbi:MAG: AmmeMemoRadiSam system protein A [Terriglobia bacterium]